MAGNSELLSALGKLKQQLGVELRKGQRQNVPFARVYRQTDIKRFVGMATQISGQLRLIVDDDLKYDLENNMLALRRRAEQAIANMNTEPDFRATDVAYALQMMIKDVIAAVYRINQSGKSAKAVIAAAKANGVPQVKANGAVRGDGIAEGLQAKITGIRRDLQRGVVDLSAISSLEGMLDKYGQGVAAYLIAQGMYTWLHAMANGGQIFEVDRQVAAAINGKLNKIVTAEARANNTQSPMKRVPSPSDEVMWEQWIPKYRRRVEGLLEEPYPKDVKSYAQTLLDLAVRHMGDVPHEKSMIVQAARHLFTALSSLQKDNAEAGKQSIWRAALILRGLETGM